MGAYGQPTATARKLLFVSLAGLGSVVVRGASVRPGGQDRGANSGSDSIGGQPGAYEPGGGGIGHDLFPQSADAPARRGSPGAERGSEGDRDAAPGRCPGSQSASHQG